jgi:hypothetical protein
MHRPPQTLGLGLVAFALIAGCAWNATASSSIAGAPVLRPDAGVWIFEKSVPPPSIRPGTDTPAGMRDWTFAPNVRVHPQESGQHLWPDIAAAEDGTIGVAWMDEHTAGGYHIFYTFSTDGGLTWASPERVDDRTTGAYSKFVSIAFTPFGTAVAVWEDDRTGQINLYFSKRTGAPGHPWTANVRVNATGGPPSTYDYMNGSLAVLDEQRYFVAWTDWREGTFYQVYMRGTNDGGATWGPEHRISDEIGYEPVAGDPCLIVDPNQIEPGAEVLYCVTNDWRGYAPGGRVPNVYYYRSGNGGATWSVGVRANDIEPGFQQTSSHALVKLDDGALAAGWLNNPDWGINHFRVCRSIDQGGTWGASVPVDEPGSGGTGTVSSIATDGSYLYAAYDRYATSWDAFFRASPDGGITWPYPSQRMDDDATGAAAGNAVIAAPRYAIVPPERSQEIHAVWQDNRAPSYDWKIYATHGSVPGQGLPEPVAPASMLGLRISPNPSRTGRAVLLAPVSSDASREVTIFDAAGRAIRSLSLAPSGVLWDGRDALGRPVPAGCFRIRASGAEAGSAGTALVRVR